MTEPQTQPKQRPSGGIRWWPGILVAIAALIAIAWVRSRADWPFQKRNLGMAQIGIIAAILLVLWWTFLSRAPKRLRLGLTCGWLGLLVLGAAMFRVRGVTGDLVPILAFRWANREAPGAVLITAQTNSAAMRMEPHGSEAADFPQFLGPDRNGVLSGPRLETNWTAHPPMVVWREKVGTGWSGFAIVGETCLTQEQRGENECVVAYELTTGRQLWLHADHARYHTAIAGEGPRATPTVMSNRVFACGATGILNCLDLTTGQLIWTRNVVTESGGKVPQWGLASSPLMADGLVIVHGGEEAKRSLFAFHSEDGRSAWSGGTANSSYTSPSLARLADISQVLAFNDGSIGGYDLATGATLWERHWGNGNVVCSSPVVVSSNRVIFSSGYGVGAELLEISRRTNSHCAAQLVWKSLRMKSKFAHLFVRAGYLYGLDDGIFACVDLQDGSQRWKEGRYGHGQGLVVNDLYLLMAESGELILLHPGPEEPNEIARFRVFKAKTWNPIAVAGDWLLVRNDQEAACLRLMFAPK